MENYLDINKARAALTVFPSDGGWGGYFRNTEL